MKIELKEISVRELTNGYEDNGDDGVIGYNGLLDIRPPYQREFIYKDKQREAVIDTINKNFPLNVMYWSKQDSGGFELIDGQQRITTAMLLIHAIREFLKSKNFDLNSVKKNTLFEYPFTKKSSEKYLLKL
jgi:uncharacterized protein with ParB-like and HNH nuclease domain